MRDDGAKVAFGIIAGLFCLLMLGWWVHEDWGRSRVANCVGGARLMAPGTWSTTWKIEERHHWTDADGHSHSGWRTVMKYTDEKYARRACKTGELR